MVVGIDGEADELSDDEGLIGSDGECGDDNGTLEMKQGGEVPVAETGTVHPS